MLKRVLLSVGTVSARRITARCIPKSVILLPQSRVISRARHYSVSTDGHDVPQEIRDLTMDVYHAQSDAFLESLQDQLEGISDSYPEVVPDIELTQGVMTLVVPQLGTYVINKQPPNKQIWLSSPVSGPNRFDLIKGNWISLRDGSKLLDLLNQELGEVMPDPVSLDA